MRLEGTARREFDIAAIPLISVVFIMLLVMMLIGTLQSRFERMINPPDAASGEEVADGPTVILIDESGRIIVNGLPALAEYLPLLIPESDVIGGIELRADKSLRSRSVMAVLSALQGAGVDEVRLIVRKVGFR